MADILGCGPLANRLCLSGIHLNAFCPNDMTQKLQLSLAKGTLYEFCVIVMSPQGVQDIFKVFNVLLWRLAENQDVVEVNKHKLTKNISENQDVADTICSIKLTSKYLGC